MILAAVSSQLMTCPHCRRAGFTLLGLAVHHCPVKQAQDVDLEARRPAPAAPPPLETEPVITRGALTRWLETGSLTPPATATTFHLSKPHHLSRP